MGPIPRPNTRRATKSWGHEYVKASQIDATPAMKQDQNIVPRRPRYRFRGSVNQQENLSEGQVSTSNGPVFGCNSHRAAKVRGRVQKTLDQDSGVVAGICNAESLIIEHLGTINDRFVHALYDSSHRRDDCDIVDLEWLFPLVIFLVSDV